MLLPEFIFKKISLTRSVIYSIAPGILIYTGLYFIMPFFLNKGFSFFTFYLFWISLVWTVLLTTVIITFIKESDKRNLISFNNYFRLNKLTGKDWKLVLLLLVCAIAGYALLSFTGKWLASISLFSPPDFFPPERNPLKYNLPNLFMGFSIAGKWWIPVIYFFTWILNISSEELWFRGYLLQRQEQSFGNYCWIINGFTFLAFHIFWKWELILLSIPCLAFSYSAHKTKNTWASIFIHGVMNLGALVPIINLV